jgi:competence protein ComEC
MLWQLSFQLSFLAVLGIILFYRPLLRLWHPPTWLLHQMWSITCVSLAAQLTTTPLSLLVFKSFPIWFLPANIVVGLVVTVAVYGCALLILLFKVPFIGAGLTWCMTQLLLFLGRSTTVFAELPLAYPAVRIDPAQCLLLYLFVFAFAAWVAWPGRATKWGAAIALLVSLIGWATRAHRVNATHRLAVHDTFTGPVLSLQHGRELLVIADSAETAKPSFEPKLETQVRTQGAHGVSQRTFGEIANTGAFRSGRWLVGIAGNGEIANPTALKVDVLLVSNAGASLSDVLRTFIPVHGIVLLPGMDGLARYRRRMECEELGIACHDVKQQGAFILEEHD